MECINCGNCKVGNTTYFCFKENGFVVDVSKQKVVEKVRSGWKKGGSRVREAAAQVSKRSRGLKTIKKRRQKGKFLSAVLVYK